jgi:hypothetical protein
MALHSGSSASVAVPRPRLRAWQYASQVTVQCSTLTSNITAVLSAGCRLAVAVSAAGGTWVLLLAGGLQLVQECCWSNLADERATGNTAQHICPALHTAAL